MNMQVQEPGQIIRGYFGTGLDAFLSPVTEDSPAGDYLRYQATYRDICEARKEDDASLPLGIWGHELKKANWPQVSRLALNALATRSKDIQLAVWLLEAEIHQQGFRGIAPAMNLLAELCRTFWPCIHPQTEDEDGVEAKTNPIAWIDDKLLPVLRLTPLTRRSSSGKDYGLADWLIARKNEGLKKEERARLPKDSVHYELLEKAMADTPSSHFSMLRDDLLAAIAATGHLSHTLDELCSGNSPSLSSFTELLGDILDLIEGEMQQRGLSLAPVASTGSEGQEDSCAVDGMEERGVPMEETGTPTRTLVYQQLEHMARYLMESDPHSPAPYLVMQACRWGNMSTRELYQELFIERQGQLHIFEVLGVERERGESVQNGQARN